MDSSTAETYCDSGHDVSTPHWLSCSCMAAEAFSLLSTRADCTEVLDDGVCTRESQLLMLGAASCDSLWCACCLWCAAVCHRALRPLACWCLHLASWRLAWHLPSWPKLTCRASSRCRHRERSAVRYQPGCRLMCHMPSMAVQGVRQPHPS